VILLVGAFDPLDEQKAQRVRADGVLKKPFVPPDPLISMVKSMINISEKNEWDEPADVPEEEDEENTAQQGWRPGALDEEPESVADETPAVRDWREEAFHGSSPAKTHPAPHWIPTTEKTAIDETVQVRAVAISTLEDKPGTTAPFKDDTWETAMPAGVEEKLAAKGEPSVNGTTEPAAWAAVRESTWEAEAKRAAMLASTWDAVATRSPEEKQDIPAYATVQATREPAASTIESLAPEPVHEVDWTRPSQSEFAAAQPAGHVVQEPVAANPPSETEGAAATAPDMDELVARVLGKMNPEVLQRVTREILKPVIEAIVRDELASKKK
jgi:hypothetical protein